MLDQSLVARRDLLKHTACGFALALLPFVRSSAKGRSWLDEEKDINGFEVEFPTMGSSMNLRWFDSRSEPGRAQEVLSSSKKIVERWVSILSDYEPSSEMSIACDRSDSGDWTPVSPELWKVIEQCDTWNRWSDGAFDAGLGALSRIRRQRKSASAEKWREARLQSGWGLIELDPTKLSFRTKTKGFRFDFGAIGKGLVADAIATNLNELGISQFVVNASGNMRFGLSPDGKPGWPVSVDAPTENRGLQKSNAPSPPELIRWRLQQCGLATSGDRWQRFPDQPVTAPAQTRVATDTPQNSSHIIDPSSLMGVSESNSVSVIAKNAADADAIATATVVRIQRNLADWLQLLRKRMPDVEVLVLSRDEKSEMIRFRLSKS